MIEFVSIEDMSRKVVVTNVRHYEALLRSNTAVDVVERGVAENVPGDLLAIDIREAIARLSEIIGDITDDDILGTIFSKFCIGK